MSRDKRLKRLTWFIIIYAVSLLAFAASVYGLKGLFKWVTG